MHARSAEVQSSDSLVGAGGSVPEGSVWLDPAQAKKAFAILYGIREAPPPVRPRHGRDYKRHQTIIGPKTKDQRPKTKS